jgi:hypothetical protein
MRDEDDSSRMDQIQGQNTSAPGFGDFFWQGVYGDLSTYGKGISDSLSPVSMPSYGEGFQSAGGTYARFAAAEGIALTGLGFSLGGAAVAPASPLLAFYLEAHAVFFELLAIDIIFQGDSIPIIPDDETSHLR